MMEQQQAHPRSGWQEDEVQLLFQAVKAAAQDGKPLRDVFSDVAQELNRKPNSIRNFYYARVRELPEIEARKAPFCTFSSEELHQLLRTVLIARGNGESVRACVTRMAEGDRGRMLRYQNKYRSVLKNRPEVLEAVAAELRAEGLPCPQHASLQRRSLENRGRFMDHFEEAARLTQDTGDDLLPLMVERLSLLLKRVWDAEARLEALRLQTASFKAGACAQADACGKPTAGKQVSQTAGDLAITLTDLRGADCEPETGADMEELVPYSRWAETRREADRLKVQVDLLKMRLEDTLKQQALERQPLRDIMHSFLSLSEYQRVQELNGFVHQAGEALRAMDQE